MKLIRLVVHVLLSTAIAIWFLRLAKLGEGVEVLNVVYVASLLTNYTMDYVGHKSGRRSPTTHEPLNASLLSALVALAASPLFMHSSTYPTYVATACGIAYSSHLVLDTVSGGIYIRDGDTYRRIMWIKPSRGLYEVLNNLVLTVSILLILSYLLS